MPDWVYFVWMGLLLATLVSLHLERSRYRREPLILWLTAGLWTLASIFSVWEAHTDPNLWSLVSVFGYSFILSMLLSRAVRQQFMWPQEFGALPSKRRAEADFEESAKLSWLAALGEFPGWAEKEDT